MKFQRILSLWLCLSLIVSLFVGVSANVSAASDIVTTPTGYTEASDVVYKTTNGYIANWGARGEDCVFLSKYATQYYTGSYTFETLSKKSGGSSQSNASSSDLYRALQNMMKAKHDYETSYNATRDLYRYTDCLRNDTNHISSFYSGKQLNGAWDSGKTWNREHTWPNSKGLSGNDENDIMMLRPTSVSENSDRGNDAYGEGSKYYDPGIAVRGDCARIVLYVYTRWGNTKYMWGQSGVMESMDILLKWMEEDPVDTWEMGRNDAVESITGVRNVFVDYPEYAWLLFGKSVPSDVTTPSNGGETEACTHKTTTVKNAKAATCTQAGYSGDTYCASCGELIKKGTTVSALGHNYQNGTCTRCGDKEPCAHKNTEVRNAKEATCTESGYSGDAYCASCGELMKKGTTVSALGHNYVSGTCTRCGDKEPCSHKNTEIRNAKEATCTENGSTGDIYCTDCGVKVYGGVTVKALGHDFENGTCTRCGEKDPDNACAHKNTEIRNAREATCTEDGFTGDTYCLGCGAKVYPGVTVKALGHDFEDGTCIRCGEKDPNGSDEPPVPNNCHFDNFTDCKDPWYHEAVDYTVANGLMKGVGEGLFDPSGSMTRGMIVTVLYRAAGSPEAGTSSFTDVEADEWYADAIAWAQKEGIVNGISDTEFAPNAKVTREQIATILWRYTGADKVEADMSDFTDTAKISSYAVDAIHWAVANGILNGSDGKLAPTDNATRAQFACIIMRYLGGSYDCK